MDSNPNLFDRFGGVRPMAEKLSESPSTIQSWKSTGRIPSGKQPGVLEKGAELGLDIIAEDVVFPLARRARRDAGGLDTASHNVACDPQPILDRAARG